MISKSQIKLITSLQQKKYRVKTGLFIAEGPKIIHDLLTAGVVLHSMYALEGTIESAHAWQRSFGFKQKPEAITSRELQKISALTNANSMLAVFEQPKKQISVSQGMVVALDQVRDPGNLGTIIRLCDWFGVELLICSKNTVDQYNPKVVQATMGSLARVAVVYTNIVDFIEQSELPAYAAVMNGQNIYQAKIDTAAILVMGNEANGISSEVMAHVDHHITIPNFGEGPSAESLNVATATGILLSEFRRTTET